MARRRGLFSRGRSSVAAAGLGGIFNAVNAAETINSNRRAAARQDRADRFSGAVKLEELGRPTSVITYDAQGRPQVNIQQGTNPERLDVLAGILGIPGNPGGAAAPAAPRVAPLPRPPSSIPESPAQKTARELLGQTFSAQNKFQDVDEQTADSAVQAGAIVGVPVTKETIPAKFGKFGELFGAKPKFRISIDDQGAAALGGAPPAAPRPAPAAPPPAAPAAPMTFASEEEALNAEQAGRLRKGQRVVIGGVPGTWQ